MNPDWAQENLQTIRTLMERSAIYRRALAPIMTYIGIIGSIGAAMGWFFKVLSPTGFILYWFGVAALALGGSFLMVRRQAWQANEPFWSPPTRRIAQAIFPPLLAGFVLGVLVMIADHLTSAAEAPSDPWPSDRLFLGWLPLLWVVLYGCAVHSAGFFISRGMRIFGLLTVSLGCVAFALSPTLSEAGRLDFAYSVMGIFFGVSHLACGTYLAMTEKGKPAA